MTLIQNDKHIFHFTLSSFSRLQTGPKSLRPLLKCFSFAFSWALLNLYVCFRIIYNVLCLLYWHCALKFAWTSQVCAKSDDPCCPSMISQYSKELIWMLLNAWLSLSSSAPEMLSRVQVRELWRKVSIQHPLIFFGLQVVVVLRLGLGCYPVSSWILPHKTRVYSMSLRIPAQDLNIPTLMLRCWFDTLWCLSPCLHIPGHTKSFSFFIFPASGLATTQISFLFSTVDSLSLSKGVVTFDPGSETIDPILAMRFRVPCTASWKTCSLAEFLCWENMFGTVWLLPHSLNSHSHWVT